MIGWMVASAPPVIITSAAPRRMISAASPTAFVPVAQAELMEWFGPRAPNRMAIWPPALSESIMGMRKGLMRWGPLRWKTSTSFKQCADPAQAASYQHAGALPRKDRNRQTRGPHGFIRRHHGKLGVPIHPPEFLSADQGGGIEFLYFGGNLRFHRRSVKRGNPADAGMSRADIFPRRFDIISDRADAPEAGYHNSFSQGSSVSADFTALTPTVEDRLRGLISRQFAVEKWIAYTMGSREFNRRSVSEMKPVYSVVVPVYNEAESLAEMNRRLCQVVGNPRRTLGNRVR